MKEFLKGDKMNDVMGFALFLWFIITLYFLWLIKHCLENLSDSVKADLGEILRVLKKK